MSVLKGLVKFKSLAAKHKVSSYVIYSGEHQQKVNNIQIFNYKNIEVFL